MSRWCGRSSVSNATGWSGPNSGDRSTTAHGRRLATRCRERHELVYRFLVALGVDPRIASVDAEGIEHHVSPSTLARFKAFVEDDDGPRTPARP